MSQLLNLRDTVISSIRVQFADMELLGVGGQGEVYWFEAEPSANTDLFSFHRPPDSVRSGE